MWSSSSAAAARALPCGQWDRFGLFGSSQTTCRIHSQLSRLASPRLALPLASLHLISQIAGSEAYERSVVGKCGFACPNMPINYNAALRAKRTLRGLSRLPLGPGTRLLCLLRLLRLLRLPIQQHMPHVRCLCRLFVSCCGSDFPAFPLDFSTFSHRGNEVIWQYTNTNKNYVIGQCIYEYARLAPKTQLYEPRPQPRSLP